METYMLHPWPLTQTTNGGSAVGHLQAHQGICLLLQLVVIFLLQRKHHHIT